MSSRSRRSYGTTATRAFAELKAAYNPKLDPFYSVAIDVKPYTQYDMDQILACKGPEFRFVHAMNFRRGSMSEDDVHRSAKSILGGGAGERGRQASLARHRRRQELRIGRRACAPRRSSVRAGEIHALMGANGAGKSTLVKVITGVFPADAGEMAIDGDATVFRSPAEARRAGIVSVYQDPALVPDLTVAQNMRLARVAARSREGRDARSRDRASSI